MQRVINVGDLVVTIKYRRKMKNIYLKVEKNAEVVVSAPPRTPNYIIKKLIQENIDEIKQRDGYSSASCVSDGIQSD